MQAVAQMKISDLTSEELNPLEFEREIFCKGKYFMCRVQKFGNWYLCFHEQKGYFWATYGIGHICETDANDYQMRKIFAGLARTVTA